MRTIATLFLVGAVALAQDAGRLEGRVVSTDGTPISKATVRVLAQQGEPRTAYVESTGNDGTFIVEGLKPGGYQVTAFRAGYTGPGSRSADNFPRVVISPGMTGSVEIQLVRTARISGTVTDADGDPLPGVTVHLARRDTSPSYFGARPLTAGSSTTSDWRGQFLFQDLEAGRYYLSAVPPAPTRLDGLIYLGGYVEIRGRSAALSNMATYYPAAPDRRGAKPVDVESAPVENLQIRMLRGPTYTIRGTIAGFSSNGELNTITVLPKEGDLNPSTSARVRPAGEFETEYLPPGKYVLVVNIEDSANPRRRRLGRAEVSVTDSNVEGVSLPLAEDVEITGKLRIEGVDDIDGFMSRAGMYRTPTAMPFSMTPKMPVLSLSSTEYIPRYNSPQIQTKDDGTLGAQGIAPIPYTLYVGNLPAGLFVKSVLFNGKALVGPRLDLTAGGAAVLDVVLSTKVASLSFRMPPGLWPPDTPPDPRGETWVWSANPSFWPPHRFSGYIAPPGNSMRMPLPPNSPWNMPPGDYFVAIIKEALPEGFWGTPESVARLSPFAARVTLREGEETVVEPKVVSPEMLQAILAEYR